MSVSSCAVCGQWGSRRPCRMRHSGCQLV